MRPLEHGSMASVVLFRRENADKLQLKDQLVDAGATASALSFNGLVLLPRIPSGARQGPEHGVDVTVTSCVSLCPCSDSEESLSISHSPVLLTPQISPFLWFGQSDPEVGRWSTLHGTVKTHLWRWPKLQMPTTRLSTVMITRNLQSNALHVQMAE
ncbi:hypothetical protein BS17DRAFT_290048 [Gyrodon lividus]|nr:hypothetical protein BS17DRAFT_290048 [Gyrodon lividus]